MEDEFGLDVVPWLKTDLLSGFSDLLDNERLADGEVHKSAVTLGSSDLLGASKPAANVDLSTDQAMHADWLKCLMAGVAPSQTAVEHHSNDSTPFPGFPAAGLLTSVPTSTLGAACTAPMSCSRLSDDSALQTPSSWDSNLSNYSLESSLLDLPAVPEPQDKLGSKLKSESSFACSELDSLNGSLANDHLKEDVRGTTTSSKQTKEHVSSTKATLADRNRERQQRFRQRQKAKIETLETQVTRLTAQTRALNAEKEDLSGRAAKLAELLQSRDRAVVNLTSQLSDAHCLESPDTPLLTLTYCNPPLVVTKSQLQKMTVQDLTKLWKEYVWQMSQVLSKQESSQGHWNPTTERLDALTSELVQLMMHLWDSCADFEHIKASGIVDESTKAEEHWCSRWQLIASSLGLTPDQTQILLALRKSMRARLQQLWAQRREVHTNMLTCMEEDLASSRDIALQHLKVKQNKEVLEEGLKQEGLLARDFEFAFYKKVLRPDQRAICIVRSYPFFPDSQALANWVAANQGDHQAHNMMTMHATSSTTSYHSNN